MKYNFESDKKIIEDLGKKVVNVMTEEIHNFSTFFLASTEKTEFDEELHNFLYKWLRITKPMMI